MLNVELANPNEPYRIFIFGDGGIGKTTFGAGAEKPIVLAIEKGAARAKSRDGKPVHIDKTNLDTWADIQTKLKDLRNDKHDFKTLVFDSATEAEKFAHKQIIGDGARGKSMNTVNKGYGAGPGESDNMHLKMIDLIEDLRLNRNMNIIVTGHAQIRENKDPQASENYDGYEPKLLKGAAGIWKEYVDACLYVRVMTILKTSDEIKARAVTDGSRVCYTTQAPSHYAKNRFGLPDTMNFDLNFWDELKPYIDNGIQPEKTETAEDIKTSMVESFLTIKDEPTKELVLKTINDAGNDIEQLKAVRTRLMEITNTKGE